LSPTEPTRSEIGSPTLAVIKRRWWVIVLTATLALAIAFGGLSLIKPTYEATATLQAAINTGVQSSPDPTYIDRVMNTYRLLADQATVRADVARSLGRAKAPSFEVTAEPNTQLLQVTASSHSPVFAQRAANAAASVLASHANTLARSSSQGADKALAAQLASLASSITSLQNQLAALPARPESQSKRLALQESITDQRTSYQALASQRAGLQLSDAMHAQILSVVQQAYKPTAPASPNKRTVLPLALAIGLLGGIALAFILERLLPRLYTVEAIATSAGGEVLAAIPRATSDAGSHELYNGGSPAQEAFDVLAVQVLAEADARSAQVILVTSPAPQDGKSTVAANLAMELARSGHQVLLIDGDMRVPSMHQFFESENERGLSTLLEGDRAPEVKKVAIQPPDIPGLKIVPAGPSSDAPARLLASKQLPRLIERLRADCQFVIFDAPPLTVSDPLSIARFSDLVLLVVRGNAVPDRDIQGATDQLRRVGADSVSVVVNRWRARDAPYSYSYGPRK
jgi:capsular exopolysaccharide synthesis family protein